MVSVRRYKEFLRPISNMDFQFLAILAAQGSMGKLFNFGKVSYFWGLFFHVFMGKNYFFYIVAATLNSWLI